MMIPVRLYPCSLKLWYFSSIVYILSLLTKFSLQACPQVNHVRNGDFQVFQNLNKFMNATQSFKYNSFSNKNGWYLESNSTSSSFMVRNYLNSTGVGLQVFNIYNESICQDYSQLQADEMYQISYTTIIDNNSHDVLHSTLWNGIEQTRTNMKHAKVGAFNLSQVIIVTAQAGINTLCFHNKEISKGLHKNTSSGSGNGNGGGNGGGGGNNNIVNSTTNNMTANASNNPSTANTSSQITNLVTGTIVDNIGLVKLIKKTMQYQISDPVRVETFASSLNNTLNQTNSTKSTNGSNSSITNSTIVLYKYKYKITTNFETVNAPSTFLMDKIYIDGILVEVDLVILTLTNNYVEYDVLLPQPLINPNPVVKIVLVNNLFRTLCGELVYLNCSLFQSPLANGNQIQIQNQNQTNNSIENILNNQSISNPQIIGNVSIEKSIFKGLIFSMQMIRTVGFSLVVMQFITLSNILILYIFTDVKIIPDRVKQALEFAAIILLKNGIISNIYQLVTNQAFQNLNVPLQITNQIPENQSTHGSSFQLIDVSYNLISTCVEDLIIMSFNILKFVGILHLLEYISRKKSSVKIILQKLKELSDQIILFQIVSLSSVWMILPGLMLSRFGDYISIKFIDKYNFAIIIIYPLIFVVFSLIILLTNQMNKNKQRKKNIRKQDLKDSKSISTLKIFQKRKISNSFKQTKSTIKLPKCKQNQIDIELDQLIGLVQNFHMIFFGFFVGIQSMNLLLSVTFFLIVIKIYLLVKIFKQLQWYLNAYAILTKSIQISIFLIFVIGYSAQKIIPSLSENQKFQQSYQLLCNSLLYLYVSGLFLQILYSSVNIFYFFISLKKTCIKIHHDAIDVENSKENSGIKKQNMAEIKKVYSYQCSQHIKFNQKQQEQLLQIEDSKISINLNLRKNEKKFNFFLPNKTNSQNLSNNIFIDKLGKQDGSSNTSHKMLNKKTKVITNPPLQMFKINSLKPNPLNLIIKNIEVTCLVQKQDQIEQKICFQNMNVSLDGKQNIKDNILRQNRRTSSKL